MILLALGFLTCLVFLVSAYILEQRQKPRYLCGKRSCDADYPGFPTLVCTRPAGHDGMHHQEGRGCHWMEGQT